MSIQSDFPPGANDGAAGDERSDPGMGGCVEKKPNGNQWM
jgi:hypothetical protein